MKEEKNTKQSIVEDIIRDYKLRQQERKKLETTWQVNINFLLGNQYCAVNGRQEIVDYEKQYFWQEREVFNHLASIYELRLSKLGRVKPTLNVLPFSDSDEDINSAKASKNILTATLQEQGMSEKLSEGIMWSEVCGTVFYKTVWDANAGKVIAIDGKGKDVHVGDVAISVVSPFEIFPDSNSHANIEDCKSIIHARAYHVDEVKRIWGVDVEGEDIDVFTLDAVNNIGGLGYNGFSSKAGITVKHDNVLVLERYETPSLSRPNGRLVIVAGNKLVYDGELPYINGEKKQRSFPFVKQCSIITPGSFWGISVIERCIPVQRAYNAIKNRKHEFLNKLSMGVLTVEDGSVDTDNLEEEGMSPGKVLIYRQGSNPPKQMTTGEVPADFGLEEDRLLVEFGDVSGVSDLVRNNTIAKGNVSGTALNMLIEQDEARLITSSEEIKKALKTIGKHVLRLYKQFASFPHTSRLIGKDNKVEMFYWKNTNVGSDEVIFESSTEISDTLSQRREMVFELLKSGLLYDENGKMNNTMRNKVLEMLGVGIWETSQDVDSLQIKSAQRENLQLIETGVVESPREIDDHELHISSHTAFMLGDDFVKRMKSNPNIEKILMKHIKEHKRLLKIQKQEEKEEVVFE